MGAPGAWSPVIGNGEEPTPPSTRSDGMSSAGACILAIETSCDDTCSAVVTAGGEIRSNVVASQGIHARYGGVVPEVAARRHLELITPVVEDAIDRAGITPGEIAAVAVTRGPGLISALLVGLAAAKGYAAAWGAPLIAVDHLQGHISANLLEPDPLPLPFLCLIASGGHTLLCRVDRPLGYAVLGQTVDDAAGEAFDKGARLLALGYPGGAALDRLARAGDARAYDLPRAAPGEFDFSFSGVKTALLYKVRDLTEADLATARADLAASYQLAIVDALVARVARAVQVTGIERVAIGGGVAANSLLRARVADLGVRVKVPPLDLCTDNAAMIAGAARFMQPTPYPQYLALDAYPTGASRP